MRRYEELKSSEVEWLEFIPKKWSLVRLKDLCIIETGSKNTEDKVDDGIYPFFVRSQTIEYINSYSFDGEAILTAGDGVGVAKVFHHFKGKFETHQRVYRISGFNKVNGRFLYYYLKENLYKEVLKYNVKATVDSLRMPMFQRFPILCPSIAEQQAIANYLDAKTQAIDKKVTLLEQKIETYKKLKRTLINQTITKGLRSLSEVEMKDSGIAWIGQIPQHWEVKRFKDVLNLFTGNSISDKNGFDYIENSIPYVSTKDIDFNTNEINYENGMYIPKSDKTFKRAKKGTCLLCIEGANAGKKYGILNQEVAFVNKLAALKFKANRNFDKYLYYYIQSIAFSGEFFPLINGLIGGVSVNKLKEFNIILPPKSEQVEIAKYLDHKTTTIDAIVSNIGKQIDTLKQLRKTLINDVVTGKIKVIE